MSFIFDSEKCAHCSNEGCFEERRHNPAGENQVNLLFKQQVALACTFDEFIPGSDRDPQPKRECFVNLQQFKTNLLNPGRYLFGEATVLKFLSQEVLQGDAFRFNLHIGTGEAANLDDRYKIASLHSLLKGGEPQRAVDRLHASVSPLTSAQVTLDDFPLFQHQ